MPNPKQSYKEKCLEQFEEQFKDSFTYGAMETWEDGLAVRDFISKALDDQMKEVMIAWEEGDSFNSFKERLKRAGLISKD